MPKTATVKYTTAELEAAVQDVRERKVAIRAAAKEYKVPESTIRFRLSNKFIKTSCGPPTILTVEEEATLATWLIQCAKMGFPKCALDLRLSVKDFLTENPRENPFKDNYPGKGWLKGFYKRHPEIVQRKPEAVSQASSCVTELNIRGWFLSIDEYLRERSLFQILEDPTRVFNGDETNFLLCDAKNLVLALRGERNVYNIDSGSKAAITAMFTLSASGSIVPPMLIYPYQRIPTDVAKSVPSNWSIGRSESGWMTSETFYEYVAHSFSDYLETNHIKRPVIYFVDGHKTHLTLQVSKLCSELDIILVALYPNATRILQPADVTLFFPLKQEWKNQLAIWRKANPVEALTKLHVAPILKEVLLCKDFTNIIINGFKATGLCPWDVDRIDFTKCLGKTKHQPGAFAVKSSEQETISNAALPFSKFGAIIGHERVAIFTTMQENKQVAEDNVLYNVWLAYSEMSQGDKSRGEKHSRETIELKDEHAEGDRIGENEPEQETEEQKREDPVKQNQIRHEGNRKGNEVQNFKEQPDRPSSALKEHLSWPKQPQRKGVRNIERMPFVISSQKYQGLLEEKARKKAEEEVQKEERKRKREDMKAQREEKKRRKQEQKLEKQNERRRSGRKKK